MTRDKDDKLSSDIPAGPEAGSGPSPEDGARTAILNAFIALAGEHGYSAVRIADVANHAGMSRQNLYRYFRNREELYRATLDELFDRFWQQAEPLFQHFDDSLSERINLMAMVLAEQHPDILRLITDPTQHHLSLNLLRRYFARILGALVRQQEISHVDRARMEVVVSTVAGASLAGLHEWVASDMQLPAADMARIMSHIFNGRVLELVTHSADA